MSTPIKVNVGAGKLTLARQSGFPHRFITAPESELRGFAGGERHDVVDPARISITAFMYQFDRIPDVKESETIATHNGTASL
jgi:hypothetical protein